MTSSESMIPGEAVERGAGVAVWRQIEQILSVEIARHGFGKEGRLPSESELAERFDVNRHTVRHAMMRLVSTSLICVEPGRGTFVQPGAIDYTIGRRTRFTENLRRQNHSPSGLILSAEKVRAEPAVSKALSIRAGAHVFEIESRHESDGVPLTHAAGIPPRASQDSPRSWQARAASATGSRRTASPTTRPSGAAFAVCCRVPSWRESCRSPAGSRFRG
jgi:GntR family transcriptional regulator, phosphonate transport system regulatory protein